MAKTHGVEAYLTAIYTLESEDGFALSSHIADYLHVSRPTVTQTIRRLTSLGYVQLSENREIMLTALGKTKAEQVIRRHRLLERWLNDDLGIGWAEAHAEADRLEHAISPLVEQRLMEKMGFPKSCPHGNIIPGSGNPQPKGILLSECASGITVQVVRIVEQAEENLELLQTFYRLGMVPGKIAHISRREDVPGKDVELHLIAGEKNMILTRNEAKWIMVKKVDQSQVNHVPNEDIVHIVEE